MGVAYSSLVCSQGIEVSVYVEEAYRQQGVATTLGSRLLLECLRYNLVPLGRTSSTLVNDECGCI